MFSKSLNQFYFALIKAIKPKKEIDLTISSINSCRLLLGLQPCQNQNIKQKIANYIKERAQKNAIKQNLNQIYETYSTLKPLQCEITILSSSSEMGTLQSTYLYKVLQYWGRLLLKEQSNIKKTTNRNEKDNYKAIINDYSKIINSTCYLINLDQNIIILYLKIHMIWQKMGADDKNNSHLRYIIEHLLALKKIREDSLQFLLLFTSRFPMQSIYHQKQTEVTDFIYKNLPMLAQSQQPRKTNPKVIINLLFNISVLTQIPKDIKNLVMNLYKNHNNPYIKFRAFNTLIDLFVIDKTNIQNQQNIKNLRHFVKQFPADSYKYLSKLFYRIDVWLKDFWIQYFEYVSTQNNYKEIQDFNHFVIDDLIQNHQNIDKDIRKAAKRFRQGLKTKGIDIQKYDLRKGYQKNFGRVKQNKNSCQLHVANSMRLICGAQILTQIPIKYFMVDVLVDNKIIVQINNTFHYKKIDGETRLNLKSTFRERVLQQNGYKCYNIKVDDLSSSNYNMLEQIYKIVEQSATMKKRTSKQAMI